MRMSKLLLLFLLSGILFNCQGQNLENTQKVTAIDDQVVYEVIPVSDFKQKIEASTVQLLDVRTPKEYDGGHIMEAVNVNYFDSTFVKMVQAKFNPDEALYLYCRSGKRSAKSSKLLQEAGFKKVYDLKGGYLAWSAENK